MRHLLLAGLLLTTAACTSHSLPSNILSIHDGDTFTLATGERIRISNIDAPEVEGSPSCSPTPKPWAWCDYPLGEAARQRLQALAASGIYPARSGVDRYGRTLATVTTSQGEDVGELLIAEGLARKWKRRP